MTDNQQAKTCTRTKQDEPILVLRVVWVAEQERILIQENGLGFLNRNAMFFRLDAFLRLSYSTRRSGMERERNYRL